MDNLRFLNRLECPMLRFEGQHPNSEQATWFSIAPGVRSAEEMKISTLE